jgi:hypothetical protein
LLCRSRLVTFLFQNRNKDVQIHLDVGRHRMSGCVLCWSVKC